MKGESKNRKAFFVAADCAAVATQELKDAAACYISDLKEENKRLKARLLAIRERVQINAIAEEDGNFKNGHEWNDLWRDHFRCWIDEGNRDL